MMNFENYKRPLCLLSEMHNAHFVLFLSLSLLFQPHNRTHESNIFSSFIRRQSAKLPLHAYIEHKATKIQAVFALIHQHDTA